MGCFRYGLLFKMVSKAIQESPDAILYAIGTDISSAQAFAEQFKIPKSYDNYDDLLNDPEISAIYIGLPNHLHKTWIIKCLNAGKHVLCEKPLVLMSKNIVRFLNLQ